MGEAIDKIIALAGTVRVDSHKRVSKSGNVITVDAYTRSLRGMSLPELRAEAGKSSNDRTKQSQVTNELRRRLDGGSQERSSQIMNPSTAPTADGRAAMEKKTDAELKTFAADTGIRAADRKFAEDELKRRGVKTSGAGKNSADASVEKMMKAQKKPKGVTLADIAYDLGVSMAAVKGMVERSKYIEKRGTRFWYVDPNN